MPNGCGHGSTTALPELLPFITTVYLTQKHKADGNVTLLC